jgi:hypothetical protein
MEQGSGLAPIKVRMKEAGLRTWHMGMGCMCGKMVFYLMLITGDRYEGDWKNCLKDGKGSDTFANGDTHTGTYLKGKFDGKGTY